MYRIKARRSSDEKQLIAVTATSVHPAQNLAELLVSFKVALTIAVRVRVRLTLTVASHLGYLRAKFVPLGTQWDPWCWEIVAQISLN